MNVSAATWNALSELLDEALDLDDGARAAWLQRVGAARPELAPALRRLLAAHATHETADVLQRLPALAAHEAPAAGLVPGERVGPYRLIRELGRGGMADVWLAERADGAFTRAVALKLPHATRLRRDLAARFARERDILARLEHPHIARLYDAGVSADGLPYLAMEYVDGEPITRQCDARGLDLAARLRLFAQVLDAVQYAHANLVIHRDLKPSNILVAADGQARLLDFGIAKLLAGDAARETRLTQLAGRALTPDYASPEQIKGEPLTIATDVYSLGVVLYELLTGQRPYRLKLESAAQLEQAIVATDPLRPSGALAAEAAQRRGSSTRALARALAGDLDTIVLKALAKAPAQRYATVAEFAEDLRRHLSGEPVHARPDSFAYRAGKFVVRHKLETAIAAAAIIAVIGGAYAQVAVAAALAAGSGVALWQARIARRQAAAAELQRSQAQAAADAARKAETRALAVQKFMSDLFRANTLAQEDPAAARRLTAQQLLDRGARTLQTSMHDAPEARVALWSLFGKLYDDLDLHQQSVETRRRAVDEARQVFGSDSLELARALAEYASGLRFQRDDRERVAGLLNEARTILARRAPHSEEYAAILLNESLWVRDRDPARAVALCGEATRLRRALAARDDSLAEALIYLGWSYNSYGQYADAERALAEARTRYGSAHGPRAGMVGHTWRGSGEALAGQLRFAEAAAAYATAVEIQLATHTANESFSPDGRYLRAQALLALGQVAAAAAEGRAIAEFVCPPGATAIATVNRVRLALLADARGDARPVLAVLDELKPPIVATAPGAALAAWVRACRFHLLRGELAAARRAADAADAILAARGATAASAVEAAAATAEVLAREGRHGAALLALDRFPDAYRVDARSSILTLELDLGKARVLAAQTDWPAVGAALQPWLEFNSAAGAHVPLAAEAEMCCLAARARRAQGHAAHSLLRRALAAYERVDFADSPRRRQAQRAVEAIGS